MAGASVRERKFRGLMGEERSHRGLLSDVPLHVFSTILGPALGMTGEEADAGGSCLQQKR